MTLRIYVIGPDKVIAESVKDAWDVLVEMYGREALEDYEDETPTPYTGAKLTVNFGYDIDVPTWAGEEHIETHNRPYGPVGWSVTATPAEWIAGEGRSWLGTTEW